MAARNAKSTKKTKTAKTTKPSTNSLAEMWKSRCYGTATILLIIILGLMIGGVALYMNYHDNIVSDEDLAALAVYDEVAESFVNGFDLKDGVKTHADVNDYGVSPDGDFYIGYTLNELDDENNVTNSKNGRIYFWTDKEDGHRSYGFSYDE